MRDTPLRPQHPTAGLHHAVIARAHLRRFQRAAFATLCALVLASPVAGQAPTAADTLRLLFIGNSFTYFNNLPAQLTTLSHGASGGPTVVTRAVVRGGQTLQGHVDDGGAARAIGEGKWDFVVLQEQSALANPVTRGDDIEPGEPARFHAAARRLDTLVRRAGARTLLYMTWARANQPQHTETIARAYERLGADLNATVAPVGRAFAAARQAHPSIALHLPDRSHPTPAGSYLAACVLYATLTGRSPVGLPARVVGQGVDDEGKPRAGETNAVLAELTAADARALQEVAWRTVRERAPQR